MKYPPSTDVYHRWLIECVEVRRWSWPKIASRIVSQAIRNGMTRRELLDEIKRDYLTRKDAAQ